MTLQETIVLCKKGHRANPVSYREHFKNGRGSTVRINNMWFCTKCCKVFKKEPLKPKGVFAK